jgi:D-3-phosphoglycerate dehydrogenase
MQILHSRDDIEVIVPDNPGPGHLVELPAWHRGAVRAPHQDPALADRGRAPDLKIISRHGVGCDNIDVQAATEHGMVVATVGLANAPSVVEHTVH